MLTQSIPRVCVLNCLLFFWLCCVGHWRASAVKRKGIWSYYRQTATLRVAGPCFSSLCPHGQWLHSVSTCTLCVPVEFHSYPRFNNACVFGLPHFVFFSIALTKLDILDTLSEIKVGVAYTVDGKPLDSFPGELYLLVLGI